MRPASLFLYFLFGALLLSSPSVGVLADEPPGRTELVEALREREQMFRSYSVQAEVVNGAKFKDGKVQLLTKSLKFWKDADCLRAEMQGVIENRRGGVGEFRKHGVYDGSRATVLSGSAGGWFSCEVDRYKSVLPVDVPAENFLSHAWGQRLSEWVQQPEVQIRRIEADGQVEVVRQLGPQSEQNYELQEVVILSPQHGYALRKRSRKIRHDAEDDWQQSVLMEVSEFTREAQTGFAVPQNATYTLFAVPKDGDPQRLKYANFTFTRWAFPAEADAETFELSVPDGILVTDRVSGKTYRTGDDTE